MEYDAEAQIKIGEFEYVKVCKSVESIQEAANLGRELQNEWHGGSGIPDTDFRDALDNLVAGVAVRNGVELWEKMSNLQRAICQEVKKSKKRLAYKEGKQE